MTGIRTKRLGARGLNAGALALVALAICAAAASADLSVSGNLFVTFNGGVTPTSLPRHGRAPIGVYINGKVRTLKGEKVPALREMVIKLNHQGKLETRGLPICRRRQVEAVDSATALRVCGGSLVGDGAYIGRTEFPEQKTFSTHGRVLAFNTMEDGHPAILTHVYSHNPVPLTQTFVFKIRHTSGTFGTVLIARVPESLYRFGYLKRLRLRLFRTYRYHGQEHSYLSAGCPAPSGSTQAVFKFAYASMSFVDGRTLWSNITRTCKVSGS